MKKLSTQKALPWFGLGRSVGLVIGFLLLKIAVGGAMAAAPIITFQPVGQTNIVGSNVVFSVTATGTAPLSYQWRLFSTNLSDGSTIFGSISGASTPTLSISDIQRVVVPPPNPYPVDVIVSNSEGSVTSSIVPLLVVGYIESRLAAFQPGDPPIVLPPGIYRERLVLTQDVVIIGAAGAAFTIIEPDPTLTPGPVLSIFSSNVTATVRGVTLRGGVFLGGGGGVHNEGTLTLEDVTVEESGAFFGGGIYNAGLMQLTRCLVRNNHALNGGGIWNDGYLSVINSGISSNQATEIEGPALGGGMVNGGTCELDQTTVNGNTTSFVPGGSGRGGGIANLATLVVKRSAILGNASRVAAGIDNEGLLSVINTTFAENFAGVEGGGLWTVAGASLAYCTVSSNSSPSAAGIRAFSPIQLLATVVADNVSSNQADCFGTVDSLGFNLIKDTNGCVITGVTTGNILGQDPLLGPLQNNGGPTLTFALKPGSPAIDAASPTDFPPTDQRGFPRPEDGNGDGVAVADIGAYEAHGPKPQTLVVTSLIDGEIGSLRQVLQLAKCGDTITFAVTGTSFIRLGSITIDKAVQILGPGSTNLILDASSNGIAPFFSSGPVFVISNTVVAGIADLTISNAVNELTSGLVSGGAIQNFGCLNLTRVVIVRCGAEFGFGGAIFSPGSLNLLECEIDNNFAEQGGGAIAVSGPFTMNRSTISGNSAFFSDGGGLLTGPGIALLTNSTVSGNVVHSADGGGIAASAYLKLESCTIVSNSASGIEPNSGRGGGIFTSAVVESRNSIIAGNSASLGPDFFGQMLSQGWNLIENPSNAVIYGVLTGNLLGVDPFLGALLDNGGPTLTHALLHGSPAIDAASPYNIINVDQRNVARPQDGNGDGLALPDIGAFEASQLDPATIPGNIIVTNLTDAGPGSLREAIAQARPHDKITFVQQGTIVLESPLRIDQDIFIVGNVTLTGVGPGVIVSAGHTVILQELTFLRLDNTGLFGDPSGGAIQNYGALFLKQCVINLCSSADVGGGILNRGPLLSLFQSSVQDCSAPNGGGGIADLGTGNLIIDSSAIVADVAFETNALGAGILKTGGVAHLINSTISGNHLGGGDGGGIYIGAGAYFFMDSCTVAFNTAPRNGATGGIAVAPGATLELKNTIVAGNHSGEFLSTEADLSGVIFSQGWNLIQGTNGYVLAGVLTGNLIGVDPLLEPFFDFNGGRTVNHALLPGSPAINAANPFSFPPVDQRGFPRPSDGKNNSELLPDIGSYEKQGTFVPRITCSQCAPSGFVLLQAAAVPGARYLIQASDSLSPPQWKTISTNTAGHSALVQAQVGIEPGVPSRFYRIVVSP